MNKDVNYFYKRNKLICEEYKKAEMTVEQIAKQYNVSTRQIQRIAKAGGVVRSIAESNKLMAKFKDYSGMRKPEDGKIKRITLPKALRYSIISKHPFCSNCGATRVTCPLNVDYIDNNPRNNNIENLQVLCWDCNQGKYRLSTAK